MEKVLLLPFQENIEPSKRHGRASERITLARLFRRQVRRFHLGCRAPSCRYARASTWAVATPRSCADLGRGDAALACADLGRGDAALACADLGRGDASASLRHLDARGRTWYTARRRGGAPQTRRLLVVPSAHSSSRPCGHANARRVRLTTADWSASCQLL